MLKQRIISLLIFLLLTGTTTMGHAGSNNPRILMETSLGAITVELFPDKAPVTVKNFLVYVNKGFYQGTIFHRVIPGFMIQGGGYSAALQEKATGIPIKNEAGNGLKNNRGTIAMARTAFPDSATAQFFINVVDNAGLNRPLPDGYGYAVFGRVVAGMDVVDRIAAVKTSMSKGMADVPKTPVLIKSVKVLK